MTSKNITAPKKLNLIIKAIRKRKNLTRDELASNMGITKACLVRWENLRSGAPVPTLRTLRRIAEALDVKIKELFEEDSSEYNYILQMTNWEKEMSFYDGIKGELLRNKNYKGKYIAIKGETIIDSSPDKFKLVKRINKKYPDESVLIVKVSTESPHVEIPSSEVQQ